MKPDSAAKAIAQDNAADKAAAVRNSKSYTSQKCPHCGKFHSGSTPGGANSTQENLGKDVGEDVDGDEGADGLGGQDAVYAEDEKTPKEALSPVNRAKSAVKARLKEIAKRK